jgi:adenine-specific DNA-methyltransferase
VVIPVDESKTRCSQFNGGLSVDSLKQLQDLLRELFQLDLADLDFGLYRLLHLRRDEIEAFLTQQLPRRVEEAFRSVAGEERAALEKEASNLTEQIRKEKYEISQEIGKDLAEAIDRLTPEIVLSDWEGCPMQIRHLTGTHQIIKRRA